MFITGRFNIYLGTSSSTRIGSEIAHLIVATTYESRWLRHHFWPIFVTDPKSDFTVEEPRGGRHVCCWEIQLTGPSAHPTDENQAPNLLHHPLFCGAVGTYCHRGVSVLAALHWVCSWLESWQAQRSRRTSGPHACLQPHPWERGPQLSHAHLFWCVQVWLQS